MRISDWSSDVCSSDLDIERIPAEQVEWLEAHFRAQVFPIVTPQALDPAHPFPFIPNRGSGVMFDLVRLSDSEPVRERSEEHTSELQSLMRISYAVFCLNKKTTIQ